MTTVELVGVAAAAGVVSLALTWPLARWLVGFGLVDRPNHRSMHDADVPRGGGAGLVVATTMVVLATLLFGVEDRLWAPLTIALSLAAVGFVDDRFNLAFTPRLVAQLVVAAAAVVFVRDVAIGDAADWRLAPTAVVTVVWFLSCCNAVNFMDGIDGITGLHVTLAGGYLAVLTFDDDLVTVPAAALAGAAVGFLYWNVVRRRVFLGDGGAYFAGALLALLVAVAAVRGVAPLVAAAPFAVYLADTGTVLVRRAIRLENLSMGHREHVYQRLVTRREVPHLTSAGFTVSCSAACALAALAVDREWISPAIAAGIVVVTLGVYLTSPRWWPGGTGR